MEKGLRQVDFQTVESLIQVHDYLGVGLNSRDANSKKAAAEASKIFQDHYPELLVRCLPSNFMFACPDAAMVYQY
jgi:phosphatidylinositol transfer protein SFH5